MRTTIELPDPLFRQVKARAALEGKTLKVLITTFVEQGLRPSPPKAAGQRHRSPIPLARTATGRPIPALTNAELEEILANEDLSPKFGG